MFMEECDACGRNVPKEKLKVVEEQYKSETLAVGTPGLVKNYYKEVYLCPRCFYLRKLSVLLGIIFGFFYSFLWAMFKERFDPGALLTIIWALLNPLVFGALFIMVFRIVTKCDTLIKTDFHSK